MSPFLSRTGARAFGLFGGLPSAFESIATATVGAGGQSTITFSSIPSTYAHLQIRYLARLNQVATTSYMIMFFNNDFTGSYTMHGLNGSGSTVSVSNFTGSGVSGSTGIYPGIGTITGSSSTASVFGAGVIDVYDYTNTNKFTTTRTLGGQDQNSTNGVIVLGSGLWMKTNAVTSITINNDTAASFVEYSQFALYGVKG